MLEIFCKDGLNLNGKTYYREAARAIILDGEKILLVYSDSNGDYKFPGGGVEIGESIENALVREAMEEAGVEVSISEEFLSVTEYDEGQFDGFDIFKMLSIYFFCKIEGETVQSLDKYEMELGFVPKWVQISKAIETNRKVMEKNIIPRWTKRETLVLEKLEKYLKDKNENNN